MEAKGANDPSFDELRRIVLTLTVRFVDIFILCFTIRFCHRVSYIKLSVKWTWPDVTIFFVRRSFDSCAFYGKYDCFPRVKMRFQIDFDCLISYMHLFLRFLMKLHLGIQYIKLSVKWIRSNTYNFYTEFIWQLHSLLYKLFVPYYISVCF